MTPAVLIVLTLASIGTPVIANSGAIAMQAFHSTEACEAAKAIIMKRAAANKFAECIEDK